MTAGTETDRFDVIIVGAGSGGTNLARTLVQHGRSVAMLASSYVGGECPYVACMPSKSLLRSARARREAEELVVHGAAGAPVDVGADDPAWARAVQRRDEVANQRDDTSHAEELEKAGIEVIRGFGRVTGPGTVDVDGRVLRAEQIVLDTGSVPVVPDIDGLDDVPHWTSDEALTSDERPARMIILGGGAIGCELAQAYSGFGTQVTVVDAADRLVPSEDEAIGARMLQVQQAAGVKVVLGVTPSRVAPDGDGLSMDLGDGRTLEADRLLVVVGRRPATDDLGVETAGGVLGDDGSVVVDERCNAAPGLWAIGDVTALAPYTHTANHQARVVADTLLGRGEPAVTPDALPRAVFTEPPLGATGLTETQARDRGFDVAVAEVELSGVSRAGAEGEGALGPDNASGGLLRLVADRQARVLLGAAAIGPTADEWIGEATLAILARIPLDVLAEVVRPFPTFPEAFTLGYDDLLTQLDG